VHKDRLVIYCKVLSWHLPRKHEENIDKTSVQIASSPTEIENQGQNYHNINLPGADFLLINFFEIKF
jgi:hypothetical protein